MRNNTHTGILLLMLSAGLFGCGDSVTPSAPSAPEPAPQSSPQPTAQPTRIQPTVAAIEPNVGSIQGGGWATITGTHLEHGATVTLGDSNVQAHVSDSTTMTIWTLAHVPGTVDVVVTNPGGLDARLTGGFTFAARESFDFNGNWIAHAGDHFETDMRFTIRNGVLVSVSCSTSVVSTSTLSPPPSVVSGEFSFHGGDGFAVSGTLVSPVSAVGTINMPAVPDCTGTRWWADKKR